MQDLVQQCPLPELAEALRPYIRSREEVAGIRRGIDSLLSEHIRDNDVPISRATLSASETSVQSALNTPFSGVRRAFIRALIARQKAQAQYDALKTELGLLQHSNNGQFEEHSNEIEMSPIVDTVALIRQRQRRDKLLIIENTLDKLEQAKQSSSHTDPTDVLNRSMPPPPLAHREQDDSLAEAQSHIFELQKAVLHAQSKIQSKLQDKPSIGTNSHDPSSIEDWKRTYALRRARDDLISWIESELAKLSEDDEADAGAETTTVPAIAPPEDIKATLQDLYEKYIESRQSLVDTLNTPQPQASETTKSLPPTQPSNNHETQPHNTSLASKIIPFIDDLRTTTHDEAALMQHTSYIRRQLTAVSNETDQLLIRLSDESHMVRPGTSHTTAWKEAAMEARDVDMEAICANLDAGENSIHAAQKILGTAGMKGR